MLTIEREYKSDVLGTGKAGRGNPVGWVDDKHHIISQSPVPGGKEHKLHSGRRVFIARAQDEGKPSYLLKQEPMAFAGDMIDSFSHQEPDGSMADIRGSARHTGKGWYLEMGRRFRTNHSDDAVIDPKTINPCAWPC